MHPISIIIVSSLKIWLIQSANLGSPRPHPIPTVATNPASLSYTALYASMTTILRPQVIGIPDERSGQVPRAYIVKEEGLLEEQVWHSKAIRKKYWESISFAFWPPHQVHSYMKEQVSGHKQLAGGVEFVQVRLPALLKHLCLYLSFYLINTKTSIAYLLV